MAPWWLHSNRDELPFDEDEDTPPAAEDGPDSAFSIGWDPDDTGSEERSDAGPGEPKSEPSAPALEPEERPRKRKRRKKRRKSEGPGDPEPAAAPASAGGPPRAEATFPLPARVATAPADGPRSFDELAKEVLLSLPERGQSPNDERKIALFCDLENIAIGVRDSEVKKFEIDLVLERLLEKGKIIVKKAYADWDRYSDYKRTFHEAAIELIDIPQKYYSGKNSADIKMVVDAMDLCYSKEHLDTFVILSGDSDFSPLVSKLKENNKYVIGIGVKNSSSNLLIDNCDEFIYYEDVWRALQRTPRLDHLSPQDAEVFGTMIDAILALIRENKNVLWGSMIKQTMQRKRPSFSEGYYGYSTFSDLLEDAAKKDIVRLKKDQRSGNYIVSGFGQRK